MTNNKQQTEINAVEWFAKQMEILHYDYWAEHISKDEKNQRLKQLKEQAKAMHKEEHFNTWWHSISENEPISFDQYYNETYGGGEQ
jgi:hypothetical protein